MSVIVNQVHDVLHRYSVYLCSLLVCLAFISIHYDASPAQSQLSIGVWLLSFMAIFFRVPELSVWERNFSILLIIYALVSLLSLYLHEEFKDPYMRSTLIYLYVFPVLLSMGFLDIKKQWLIYVLLLAVLASFLVLIKEYLYGGSRGNVAHGTPIVYGNVSLMSSCLIFTLLFSSNINRPLKLLMVLGFFMGVAASIWSQSRGGWLLLPVTVIFVLFFYFYHHKGMLKKRYFLLFCTIVISLLIVVVNNKYVKNRVDATVQNVENYFEGNRSSSIGVRFELWRASLSAMTTSPFWGVGREGFRDHVRDMADQDVIVRQATHHEHSHNDYLWILATKGIVGLAAYAALMLYLLFAFYRAAIHNGTSQLGVAGLILIVGYGIFSISDIFFSVKMGIGYFIIMAFTLLRLISINNRIKNEI